MLKQALLADINSLHWLLKVVTICHFNFHYSLKD
jgi:hypothetical protein